MATQALQAESVPEYPTTVHMAFNAWRFRKAVWEAAMYAPDRDEAGTSDEVLDPLYSAECEAFDQFLQTPAATIGDLARKLEAFRDEDGSTLCKAEIYLAIFAKDARRLHLEHARRSLRAGAAQ